MKLPDASVGKPRKFLSDIRNRAGDHEIARIENDEQGVNGELCLVNGYGLTGMLLYGSTSTLQWRLWKNLMGDFRLVRALNQDPTKKPIDGSFIQGSQPVLPNESKVKSSYSRSRSHHSWQPITNHAFVDGFRCIRRRKGP